jgi:hypothetical protein
MRRALWPAVGLLVITLALSSCASAVERELAGVRLGQRALDLLDAPAFGQPDYIGPLATLGSLITQQTAAGQAATGTAATRSGPTGPGGAQRGMRRVASRQGQAPGASVALTAGMMGGRRGGMGGGRAGGRTGGMGGRATGAGAARGRGAMGGTRGGAARGAAAGGGARAVEGAGMYWYYRRPGGAVLVLTLDTQGTVTALTLSGALPYPAGRTSRGIGLTSTYMDIIGQYGYPDQALVQGAGIQLTYVDHGVRFQLEGMAVREIAIGAYVVAGVEAAPAATPESVTPPAPGLNVEELRGYL